MLFCCQLTFFSKSTFSEIPLEYQTVWIQIRPDTLCTDYQQTTLIVRVEVTCNPVSDLANDIVTVSVDMLTLDILNISCTIHSFPYHVYLQHSIYIKDIYFFFGEYQKYFIECVKNQYHECIA